MPALRLLHFADAHLGVESFGRIDPATGLNTRLLDFTKRLDDIVSYAIEQRIDLVLFAGDAYRSRDPSPTQQREFARRIRRLSQAGVLVFLLVGNHDLPAASGRANSLDIFDTLAVPNVTVGRSLGLYPIETRAGRVQIAALPWLRRSAVLATDQYRTMTADEVRRQIEELASDSILKMVAELEVGVPAILAGHLSVEGATYGSERSVLVGEDIVLPRSALANPAFSYVALGHIHKHQALGDDPPIVYPGSIERVDFGEEHDAKGFVTAEIGSGEASWQFHPLDARRFVTVRVRPSGEDPTAAVLHEIERSAPADAIVRLIVEASAEVDAGVDYGLIRRALRDAFCVASIRREVARADRRTSAYAGVESMSPEDAFDVYLRTREVPEERRVVLRRYATQLIGQTA